MSAFGGGQTAFQIFSDNAENQNAGIRKTKREDFSGKPPATKRAALGVISNNTRVQPLRAVKQGHATDGFGGFNNAENAQPKQAKVFDIQPSQPFTIHIDNELPQTSSTRLETSNPVQPVDKLSLHSGITSLRAHLAPIQSSDPILIDDSPNSVAESPMLLDTSVECQRILEDSAEARLQKVLSVPEYTDEIYTYLRECELRYRSKAGYMKKQPDINSNMRNILVDWLVEVAEEYRLHRETLMLAVNYIDRFLSQMSVLRGKLQLVGAASMFLAAKYEEIYPPEVNEFVYITDDTYTKKQVLKMEHLVLKVLSFDVAAPTINLFCERFLKESGYTEEDQIYQLTMMLAEFTLIDVETYGHFLPSQIASASLCLANHTMGETAWPELMVQRSGYTTADLNTCVQALFHTHNQAASHPQQAVRDKYKQSKLKEVANLSPASVLPPGCTLIPAQVV